MGLFNDDLNKTTVMMVNVIKGIKQLNIKSEFDVDDKENELCVLAYFCRVGILDRIERNKWSLMHPIAIPTGLFGMKNTTIANGLELTVGKLKELSKKAIFSSAERYIEEILKREGYFWDVDAMLLPEVKARI